MQILCRPLESSLSDEEDNEEDEDSEERRKFAFPELDAKIREAVEQYGAVFPKLNFSSPRVSIYVACGSFVSSTYSGFVTIQDAAWMLPAGSPMKCTSPSDVYMLLKSSDFVLHDIDPAHVFEGCEPAEGEGPAYDLELVLRKWYPVDRSRELRCFVRREKLLGKPSFSRQWPTLISTNSQVSLNAIPTTTIFGTSLKHNLRL